MRTVALGQILILLTQMSELPLSSHCVNNHIIKRKHDFMFQLSNSDINGAGQYVHI